MSIEKAKACPVEKPWGRTDLSPWQAKGGNTAPIGEVWFERADPTLPASQLLFKLLFTATPLSIQVHPDDAHAQARGLPNGKTEAWFVLSADHDARIGLGLKNRVSEQELRAAIADRSVVDLLAWRKPRAGDAFLVPAGAIHAIGVGVILAEVQQRSDTTYRLFDHGRQRELHVEEALAVADRGPVAAMPAPVIFATGRSVLVASAYFVIERIRLAPGSQWRLQPGSEAWLFVLEGSAQSPALALRAGEAFFIADGHADLHVGDAGVDLLVSYAAPVPQPGLLHSLDVVAPVATPLSDPLLQVQHLANRSIGADA